MIDILSNWGQKEKRLSIEEALEFLLKREIRLITTSFYQFILNKKKLYDKK